MGTVDKEQVINLIKQTASGEKYPLAKLISEIERIDSFEFRKFIFEEIENFSQADKKCITIGFTGTPGAGKSSLIGQICQEFLKHTQNKRLAILAIDPSSNISGGSILGDRTRVTIPARENRIFFRSQPSQLELGGLNPFTYHVLRLLRYFFDYVIVETVGIGQNEIEVSKLTDYSFLILQPLAGDQIQFMKSGIMEVPDAFVINKCDEKELAAASYHTLITSLDFLKDTFLNHEIPPIFQTSVINQIGIRELFDFMLSIKIQKNREEETKYQISKWVKSEYGNFGLRTIYKSSIDLLNFNEQYENIESKIVENIFKSTVPW
ncbi:MAG: protein kinase [Leptospiraceae bacterium]|nr:protein kinase [Leptospiraceae bacterium]MCP5496725.1 protein kinase [Leptospiraceae bacterium]